MRFAGFTCAALMDQPERNTGGHRKSTAFQWPDGKAFPPARDDGQVRHDGVLQALGLEGLIDAHSHWFPETIMRKIWKYFDRHYWPITYRQLPEGRLEWVRRNKIKRFTTLNYAHRPGMAAWLNEWTAEFVENIPEAVPCGTFYQEPGVGEVVRRCIEEYRFKGFKLHLRVSDMDPTQALLAPAFEQLEHAGLPVVIHCGSAPDPGRFTTPEYLIGLLNRFPRLKVVVAHMGAWDWDAYLGLAEQREFLYLDTTMVFVGFRAVDPAPVELFARMEAVSHKILFGSDFPNIPYPISHAVLGIDQLPMSHEAKRRILFDNAAALFGLEQL